jgi:glyoxylase-like metal-dependent hydrolase (beta-lactamase superfamily II)
MRVTDRVHALKIPFTLKTPLGAAVERFVYAYVIFGPRIRLVDSGVAGSEKEIFGYIRDSGRDPGEISSLVLTHAHPDHIGAARAVKEATGCAVFAHPAERPWIEDVERQSRERPVPGFHALVGGPVDVDGDLEDGGEVDAGGDPPIEVIHTPGHSRGSISLRLPSEGVLITGDAVPVPGGIPIYDDVASLVRSLRLLMGLDGVRFLLSSWDDPIEGDRIPLRFQACFRDLRIVQDAAERNADLASDPMEMCRRVLGELGLPPAVANPLIATSIVSHVKVREMTRKLFRA